MIHAGDCVSVMAGMEPDSIDAVVCDPPYGLEFMGKEWDRIANDPDIGKSRRVGFDAANGARDRRPGNEGGTWFGSRDAKTPNYTRATNAKCRNCGKWRVSGGHGGTGNIYGCRCERPDFPNVAADAARRMQEWHTRWATEALRVAKPGAYLLAFGGTRTVHRLTVALEDAGWIIRDLLVWAYAQGFPKSRSSLKPAWEPIVLARKPGPLRELGIDACRIGYDGERVQTAWPNRTTANSPHPMGSDAILRDYDASAGRWPANVILTDPIFDGDAEGVVGGGETYPTHGTASRSRRGGRVAYGDGLTGRDDEEWYRDSGTYSRFFLIPKASRSDREPKVLPEGWPEGKRFSGHPTVKPTALMRHLIRLVTPEGGTVLDPFLGSGTTAKAAVLEGFDWVGIEREPEYIAIARQRLVGLEPEPQQMAMTA